MEYSRTDKRWLNSAIVMVGHPVAYVVFDTFALVRRRGTRLSPATRAQTDALREHLPGR
jgi:hypothetical protein